MTSEQIKDKCEPISRASFHLLRRPKKKPPTQPNITLETNSTEENPTPESTSPESETETVPPSETRDDEPQQEVEENEGARQEAEEQEAKGDLWTDLARYM